jgi:hypothetical protein
MAVQRKKKWQGLSDALGLLLFIILLPLIAVAIALYLAFCVLRGAFLSVLTWRCWCAHGRYVLFVYSDSPIWHDYIEEHILPRLGERAVILNWSQRSQWKRTLAVMAFRYFGGVREFNPMAVVFRPFRLARRFRFYEPFCEFKHGKPEAVTKMEKELFDLVDGIAKADLRR